MRYRRVVEADTPENLEKALEEIEAKHGQGHVVVLQVTDVGISWRYTAIIEGVAD